MHSIIISTFLLVLVEVIGIFILLPSGNECLPLNQRHLSRARRAFSYIANETACKVDHIVYREGEPVPTDDPCETCRCRPPGFSCVLRDCEVKSGCRSIRRIGECCPQYQCGCEHNGKYYRDGERVPNAESPCYSCYCQGSSITCSLADCAFRFDCEPDYVSGECCPRYDHCPPDEFSVTVKSTEIPRLTTAFFANHSTVTTTTPATEAAICGSAIKCSTPPTVTVTLTTTESPQPPPSSSSLSVLDAAIRLKGGLLNGTSADATVSAGVNDASISTTATKTTVLPVETASLAITPVTATSPSIAVNVTVDKQGLNVSSINGDSRTKQQQSSSVASLLPTETTTTTTTTTTTLAPLVMTLIPTPSPPPSPEENILTSSSTITTELPAVAAVLGTLMNTTVGESSVLLTSNNSSSTTAAASVTTEATVLFNEESSSTTLTAAVVPLEVTTTATSLIKNDDQTVIAASAGSAIELTTLAASAILIGDDDESSSRVTTVSSQQAVNERAVFSSDSSSKNEQLNDKEAAAAANTISSMERLSAAAIRNDSEEVARVVPLSTDASSVHEGNATTTEQPRRANLETTITLTLSSESPRQQNDLSVAKQTVVDNTSASYSTTTTTESGAPVTEQNGTVSSSAAPSLPVTTFALIPNEIFTFSPMAAEEPASQSVFITTTVSPLMAAERAVTAEMGSTVVNSLEGNDQQQQQQRRNETSELELNSTFLMQHHKVEVRNRPPVDDVTTVITPEAPVSSIVEVSRASEVDTMVAVSSETTTTMPAGETSTSN